MTGGSEEKEMAMDKQCPKCGLWYAGRGAALDMHMASCDGDGEVDAADTTEDPEPTGNVSDGAQGDTDDSENPLHDGPKLERGSSVNQGEQTPERCPDCGEELYDFRGKETWTDPGGRMHDTPDDFYCLDGCGQGFSL